MSISVAVFGTIQWKDIKTISITMQNIMDHITLVKFYYEMS